MKKIVVIVAVIMIILCSCTKKTNLNTPYANKIPTDNVFVFECDKDEFYAVHYQDDVAFLYHNHDVYKLPRAISADGARYSDGVNEFWNKGDMALITIGDTSYQNCQLIYPNERQTKLSVDYFWGMSDDPLWSLSIFNSEIVVFFDKNNKTYQFDNSILKDSIHDEKIYTAQSNGHEIKVIIDKKSCYNKKSDQTFPYKVKLILDGKEYHGCGNASE